MIRYCSPGHLVQTTSRLCGEREQKKLDEKSHYIQWENVRESFTREHKKTEEYEIPGEVGTMGAGECEKTFLREREKF